MTSSAQLVACQNCTLDTIKNDISKFTTLSNSALTEARLKIMLSDLEDSFKIAKLNHNQLLGKKSSDVSSDYITNQVFDQLREQYYTYWAMITERLSKFKFEEDNALNQTVNATLSNLNLFQRQNKLEELKIPKFSGSYSDWKKFYNLFQSNVHQNTNLDNIQKLSYLQTYVTGEASDLIKDLEMEESNYGEAIKILKDRYDHKRRLVYAILHKLFDQPQIKKEDSVKIRQFLNVTNECIITLKNLGAPVQHWDYILLFAMEQKLPKETKRCWEKSLGDSREMPEFSEFLEFIRGHFRMLEMMELDEPSTSNLFFVNKDETTSLKV